MASKSMTPAEWKTLTEGLDPDKSAKFLKLLRDVVAWYARLPKLPKPPEPPPRDPEIEARVEGMERLLRRMGNARLVTPVQIVRLVGPDQSPAEDNDGESVQTGFFRMLDSLSREELKTANNSQLAQRWQKRGGRGKPDYLRGLARRYRSDPRKR